MEPNDRRVLDKIFAVYDSLYEAEKKIADYVIANQIAIIEMTVSQLAAKSKASEATVIRFCKKCGLRGFHDLKITIAKEMVAASQRVTSNNIDPLNIKQSLKNILANKLDELTQTVAMMDEAKIKQILTAIKAARLVQFVAVGNTIPVAMDGAYKLNQIGIGAISNTVFETQLAFGYTLTSQDVVIAISSSGASKRLVTLVQVAKGKGATTIAITNHDSSPLAHICNYHITTATREKLFLDEFSFSRVSAMTVIEILYLLLVAGKDDAYSWVSAHEHSIGDDKV